MSRSIQRIISYVLCVLMLMSLSGCKDSPVFAQTVYNQQAPDVSDVDEILENSPDNQEEDEDIFSVDEREDAQTERGFENTEALYDPEGGSGEAANADYFAYAGENGLANTGSEEPAETEPETEEAAAALGEDETDSSGQGEGALVVIVDDTGAESEIVTASSVLATGEAAIVVQMLGGEGALAGTDRQTYEKMAEYFPAKELSQTEIFWDTDGTGDFSMDAWLSMEDKPMVCLLDAQMENEDTVTALQEQGVWCVELDFRSATGILSAVELVRQILATDTASRRADEYFLLYQDITETLSSKVGTFTVSGVNYDNTPGAMAKYDMESTCEDGKYTLFISGWDAGQTLRLYRTDGWTQDFSGLAITTRGYTSSPISYFMSLAGVVNNAAANATGTRNTTMYVNTFSVVVQGETLLTSGSYGIEMGNSLQVKLASGLGSASFPALVVASQSIRTAMEDSAASGQGMWTVYDYIINDRGFMDGNDTLVNSVIAGDYDIYVNPNGLGNWMTGSAESLLEMVWVAAVFHDTFSETQVEDYVQDFYKTFYRCNLTQAQLEAILEGDV